MSSEDLDVLPAPDEMYLSKKVADEDDATSASPHVRATVRYLSQTEALTVWVHYRYCDFTGRGYEMFSGNDSLSLDDFKKKFPIKMENE